MSYSSDIKRLTYEDIDCDDVTTDYLDQKSQSMLERGGITELFPVQKAAYKLFVEGEELIVKSKTGSGKTLAFLLPLQELLRKQEAEIRVVPHRSLNQLPPEMGKDKHLGKAQVGRTEKILEWFSCN